MPANRFYNAFDAATLDRERGTSGDHRTPFQIDRDRILHSSALRRLQRKTQVFHSFLTEESDSYRTRLTHSLEVAQVGRSICDWLAANSPLLAQDFHLDSDLVEAACLAHDLGHPPFGHTGERALHRLMQPYGGFEGNAQTLRLLTRTLFGEGREGMNPTRALLDAVLKYKTLRPDVPGADNHYLYGEQREVLDFVLGGKSFPDELPPGKIRDGFRSIECQIIDWADDTAYSINDLADAVQTGFITATRLEAWAEKQTFAGNEQRHAEFLIEAIRDGKVEGRLARGIGDHIRMCSLRERGNFLSGDTQRYALELVVDEDIKRRAKLNKRIARELVFDSPQLQQLDFKAGHILQRLFDALCERYIESGGGLRLHLLPESVELSIDRTPDASTRARLVCDWISNLTDRAAIRVYQRFFEVGHTSMSDLI
jgi:dGTPase